MRSVRAGPVGARSSDILSQFLVEAVVLSAAGGLVGIAVGLGGAWGLARVLHLPFIVPVAAVPLAFGVSVLVGVLFGVFPAQGSQRAGGGRERGERDHGGRRRYGRRVARRGWRRAAPHLGGSGCPGSKPPVQNTLKADGEACAADEECESSLCDKLPGKPQVCFRKCSAGCKAGDLCTALAVNDRFACVPDRPGLCQPCSLNVDCPYPGDRCLELGGTKVCARDCGFDGQCPSSYRCADGIDTNGAFAPKQCQPTSGTCDCTAASAGQTRPCSESNAIGTCTGLQTCKPPNGYDACSATVPATESCNGRDDDCNGMTDENLGETTCGQGECRNTITNCVSGAPQTV